MNKRFLSSIIAICCIIGFLPALTADSFAVSQDELDSSELLGDKQTAKACVICSCLFMDRRRVAIEASYDEAKNITVAAFTKSATGSTTGVSVYDDFYHKTQSTNFRIYRLRMYSSKAYDITNLAKDDSAVKAITGGGGIRANYQSSNKCDVVKMTSFLCYMLDNHPEGIVIWAADSGNDHAVLLTDYYISSGSVKFNCADPVDNNTGKTQLKSTYTSSTGATSNWLENINSIYYIRNADISKNATISPNGSNNNNESYPSTPSYNSNTSYYIYAYCGKVVEVADSKTNDKANVQIWAKSSRNLGCQKFNITPSGNYYTITAVHSGKALDIADGSSASGTNVWQWHVNNTAAQQWTFEDAGNGYVYIRSALGTYLDVKSNGTDNGTNVWAYEYNGREAQMFKIVNAETGEVASFGRNSSGNEQNSTIPGTQATGSMNPRTVASGENKNNVNVYWNQISDAEYYDIYLEKKNNDGIFEIIESGKVYASSLNEIMPGYFFFEGISNGEYRVSVLAVKNSKIVGEENSTTFVIASAHNHSLRHVNATAADCTTSGNVEYWYCTDCGKYFSDANAKNEISPDSINLPPLGHNYVNGGCTRCGAKDPEYTAPQDNKTPSTAEHVSFNRCNVYYQGQFSDVPAGQWFTDSVAEAYELGLMKGSSENSFNPYGDVTLAETITMAARIHSIYTYGEENFDQSTGGMWYQTYLDYAYNNGIIARKYYNTDVTKKATRAQFAEIFAKSLPEEALSAISSIADGAIPDVDTSDSYAQYVYLLYRAGILTGGDAMGTFSPQTFITRAEAATIVSRMAESDNRKQFTLR